MIGYPNFRALRRGYTLVELVTTIVIVGILGAAGIPKLFDYQAISERGYVDEVASAIRYAQKIAIASRCEVSVTIGAGGYVANQRDTFNSCNSAVAPWAVAVRRSDGSTLSGTAPAEVAMAPAATLIFDRNGHLAANPPLFTAGIFSLNIDKISGAVTVLP